MPRRKSDPLLRFWKNVDKGKPDECWAWKLALTPRGYGTFSVGAAREGSARAHRWIYQQVNGTLPPSTVVDHICRNRACVNPAHLKACSHRENLLASGSVALAAKNAAKTHCVNGHAFTPDNVYRTRTGTRMCRECGRINWRRYHDYTA